MDRHDGSPGESETMKERIKNDANDSEFMREDVQSDVRILGGQAQARRCLNFSIFQFESRRCTMLTPART
jgi:hypothetical protein